MFLQPSEVGFLKYLKEARVPVVEFDFPAKKIVNVQSQLEKLISQNYYLNKVSLISFLADSSTANKYHSTVCKRRLSLLPPGLRLPLLALRL
jgi:hypothetical protein